MFVEQRLVLLVSSAEILEKFMGQSHQLVHPHVVLAVVGDLQQVQNDRVDAHVTQKALLVLPGFVIGSSSTSASAAG